MNFVICLLMCIFVSLQFKQHIHWPKSLDVPEEICVVEQHKLSQRTQSKSEETTTQKIKHTSHFKK